MSKLGRVLLADDSPHAQRMGERILREEGYEVVTVTDGETAILRVKDVNPDVVIVDAFLPQVSGYDLCGFIKKQPQHSHVRVLLTSTALERVDEDLMFRAGADGQLKKPFEASVMLKSLKDLISGSDKDSKKKRTSSTFNLNDYEGEGGRPPESEASDQEERSQDRPGVSPLKAWLEQHDDETSAVPAELEPVPVGVSVPAAAASAVAAAVSEPVSLSNPQLLRRIEDEEEDLSLRNNPVAKLRNVPASPGDGGSKLQSISGRTQETESDSGPTTRSFRIAPKQAETEEPLLREEPESPAPTQAKPRRSLLDALAEYENEAAVMDAAPDPLSSEEGIPALAVDLVAPVAKSAVEVALEIEDPDAEAAQVLEPVLIQSSEEISEVAEEIIAAEVVGDAHPESEASPESDQPKSEILAHAAAAVAAQGEIRRLALGASGVRLDEEEIRAAVEIAVSAAMESIVDEVTRYITMALETRYRQSNEAPADKASD